MFYNEKLLEVKNISVFPSSGEEFKKYLRKKKPVKTK